MTAVVRLRTAAGGAAGFAWRASGQKDFPPGQVATFQCEASDDWQEHRAALTASSGIIHLRLLLPGTSADIAMVEIRGARGNPVKSWRFAPKPSR